MNKYLSFNYHMPVKIFFSRNCIKDNASVFKQFGKKAMLVTGKKSAKINGSEKDVCDALEACNISWKIFDRAECNPTIENVRQGANAARAAHVDFIIGIGGGSPIDAAKAIAVLVKNDFDNKSLFDENVSKSALPVVAVPTTAGTGSEVTQYSIITDHKIGNKRNLSSENIFPCIAFLDPVYTEHMPHNITVNTAIDAFSHSVEGFLSNRATNISSLFSIESIEILGRCLPLLIDNKNPDSAIRDQLFYASLLGGIVISQTGTTAVHPMGYPLTLFKNIDHGRANGLLMYEYLVFASQKQKNKISAICKAFSFSNLVYFRDLIDTLLREKETITDNEIKDFSFAAMQAKSIACIVPKPSISDIEMIYRKSFGK